MNNRAKAYLDQAIRVSTMTRWSMVHLSNILRRVRRHGLDTGSAIHALVRRGVLQPADLPAAVFLERAVLAEGPEFDPVQRQRFQDARQERHMQRIARREQQMRAFQSEHVYVGSDRRKASR